MADFTKLRGVDLDHLDEMVNTFTPADWDQLESGYLDVAAIELGNWWAPMLGLPNSVEVVAYFCRLYQLSLARNPEV